MIEKITNHIAIQSQEWFTNSLLKLMEEKKFSNITITEIAAKSDLSSRTFYRIFETKIDILVYYTDKLYDKFLELLKLASNPHFTAIIRLYFEF